MTKICAIITEEEKKEILIYAKAVDRNMSNFILHSIRSYMRRNKRKEETVKSTTIIET